MAGEVERLSGKLGLDTTDFKTALGAANRELRVLESGFKASAAALGDWTKDATGLENRVKSLTGQIDIQKLKVNALAAEHKRLADEHGETSRAAQEAEIKLNKETETLNKMERELNETGDELVEMRRDSENAAKGVDKLGDEESDTTGRTVTLKAALMSLGAGFTTVVVGIGAAVTALVAMAAAVAVVAIGVVAFTVGPASDLNETISKTQVVFGDAAEEVLAFGETSADSLGLSENAALSAAGTYGNLLRAMGLSEDASADMSISLVELASDLASFNNMGTDEVLEKLRAGLTGESEPLKTLGVNMNEARIKAKALELGLAEQGEELTAAAKAQAAYAIIMEDTALAQGDFARTSEGLANQQRIVAANFENLRAKMGTAFLPIVNLLAQTLNDLFSSDEFNDFFDGLVTWLGEATKQLKPFLTLVGDVLKQILKGDFSGALATLFGSERATQILGFVQQVQMFIGNLVAFITEHSEEIKAALIGIGVALAAAGIVGIIAGIIAAINPVTLIIAALVAWVGIMSAAWAGNWLGARDIITQIWEGFLKPTFEALGEWLSTNIPLALQALSSLWTGTLLPAIQAVWGFLSGSVFPLLQQLWIWLSVNIPAALQTLSNFWTGTLLPAIQAVWGFLSGSVFPLFQAIGQFISAVFNLYLRVLAGLWQNVLLPALQAVWGFLDANVFPIFRAIGAYISEKLQPVFDRLASFLKTSLTPAFSGIIKAIQSAVEWITNLADSINNLQLPAWLTPGSPTPWELGLWGINEAMRELNQQMPVMARGLDRVAASGANGPSQVSNSSTQNDNFAFYAPVVLQGSTPPQSLGARLKGRRY